MFAVIYLFGVIWLAGMILKFAFKLTGAFLKVMIWIPILVLVGLGFSAVAGAFALAVGILGFALKLAVRALPLVALLAIIYFVVKSVWGDEVKKDDTGTTEVITQEDAKVYREFRESESPYARKFNNLQ